MSQIWQAFELGAKIAENLIQNQSYGSRRTKNDFVIVVKYL